MFRSKKEFNLEEWSAAVYGAPILHPEEETESHLAGLTEMLILQDVRIILESEKILRESANIKTRESRYFSAQERYRHLLSLKKYARPYSEGNLLELIQKAEKAMESIEEEKTSIPARKLKEYDVENAKLIQTICTHCGAPMKVRPTSRQIVCEYCGATSVLDKNPWQVEYVNSEQAGYEFEQGRIRAREETEVQRQDAKHSTEVSMKLRGAGKEKTSWWYRIINRMFRNRRS